MGFDTPELAALAEWAPCPTAQAFVVSVTYPEPGVALVVTDTVPSHPMLNHCRLTDAGWIFEGDQNWHLEPAPE